jgi:hypothetical protein
LKQSNVTSGLCCDWYQSAFRRFYTDKAKFAELIKNYGANELRFHQSKTLLRNIEENFFFTKN